MPSSHAPATGPLAGIQAIEMSAIGPVPLAGQLLADLGAKVTVIDRRETADDPAHINRRGKTSTPLDLKTDAGRAAALELIAEADLLMEGFRPGVMERLGLGPEPCLALNPRLIYGRMTGWGQTGPRAGTAGHDINYLAITGALHAIGVDGAPPVPPLNLVGDYGGGTAFLLLGLLAALVERGASGKGQVVDAAIVDGVPAMMGLIHQWLAGDEWREQRQSNLLDGGAPWYGCYRTADNRYLAVGALEDEFFAELAEVMGLSADLIVNRHRRDRWPEMRRAYADIFGRRTRDDWLTLFAGRDACVTPVLSIEEAETEPQLARRRVLIRRDGVLQANVAPRFSRTPGSLPPDPTDPGDDRD